MSRKKDKRIKKLHKVAVWPAIVELFIIEIILFVMAISICLLAVFGVFNTVVLNNEKNCRTVVEFINENWNKTSPQQLDEKLSSFETAYGDIKKIIINDKNNSSQDFINFEKDFDHQTYQALEKNGMIHFFDLENDNPYSKLLLALDNGQTSNVDRQLEIKTDILSYSPLKMFRAMHIFFMLQNTELITWASETFMSLPTVAYYKTDVPGVNIVFKNSLELNIFQVNLIISVVLFLVLVMFISGIFEVSKFITIVRRRKIVNLLVTTDTVTGGFNKDSFMQKAKSLISRRGKQYAVVQLRLEKYRNYCTAYGLKQGENLLEDINTILSTMIGKKEFVAHIEKSDFAILLYYPSKEALDRRIRNMMNNLREHHGKQHLTFSAGVCPVLSKDDDLTNLLTCAGLSLTSVSKIQDDIVWFDDAMKEEQVWERRIEDDMEKALENQEFKVYLQPKYSTRKEKLSAAEALVRWVHPVLGFISPGKFIPIFERNGFILQLDDYMLREVSRLQALWASEGKKLVPISVNISRAHFAVENLAEHICSIVDEFKVDHKYIELELTESAFFDDKTVLLTTVRSLKALGFKVSMDDFGAGYSSLNSLKELPLDIIKLDAEFFRSVDDVERSNLIVGQTIYLAKKLGMEIVAEGIETREQVDFLAEQNCDLIQGFYFSKPLTIEEFEKKAYA